MLFSFIFFSLGQALVLEGAGYLVDGTCSLVQAAARAGNRYRSHL